MSAGDSRGSLAEPGEHGGTGGPSSSSEVGRRRRRWRGPLLVLLAMVVAFVIGALVGTRSELFPPQVEGDTGAPTVSSSVGVPAAQRWAGVMTSVSSQEYSAGPCVTDWRSSLDLIVDATRTVRGTGHSRLVGKPRCPFPTTQPQIDGYDFDVRGRFDQEGGFSLSLEGFTAANGIFDYGGFATTMAASKTVLDLGIVGGARAQGRLESHSVTNLGKLVRTRSVVRLVCRSCDGS